MKNNSNTPITVFAFMYNSCIYESDPSLISLHFTKDGALCALKEHREKEYEEFIEYVGDGLPFNLKFGEDQDWIIKEINILP